MNFLSYTKYVKYTLLSLVILGHVVIGQEIIDFGAKDRAESDRLQKVIEELCKNRPVNEYFRLSAESNCRDAVRCVNSDFGGGPKLAAIRCPAGLVFDLDGQTCNWASQVRILQYITLISIRVERIQNMRTFFVLFSYFVQHPNGEAKFYSSLGKLIDKVIVKTLNLF